VYRIGHQIESCSPLQTIHLRGARGLWRSDFLTSDPDITLVFSITCNDSGVSLEGGDSVFPGRPYPFARKWRAKVCSTKIARRASRRVRPGR
jgi:hypothetical protein